MVMPARECEICGDTAALPARAGGAVLCSDIQCQNLVDQASTMAPGLYAAHRSFQAKLIRERRARDAEHLKTVDAVKSAEARQDRLIASSAGLKHLSVIPIPSAPEMIARSGSARTGRYQAHLEEALAAALACDDISELVHDRHYALHERRLAQDAFLSDSPGLATVSDRVCALCRGGCCTEGGDHAYISPVLLRRQLDASPDLSGQQLVSVYMSVLPDESIAGSCINHGINGCVLPREMRSDVCNHFLCDPLRSLHSSPRDEYELLVIQRDNHQWNRFQAGAPNPVVRCYRVNTGQALAIDLDIPEAEDVAESDDASDSEAQELSW
ncbi:hypothetical protein [Thalassolituus sp.]|uniref:hypothetical protein n=2 Tax=Thalassolituus sp. TaxID=2030822 RepID=UPI003517BE3C